LFLLCNSNDLTIPNIFISKVNRALDDKNVQLPPLKLSISGQKKWGGQNSVRHTSLFFQLLSSEHQLSTTDKLFKRLTVPRGNILNNIIAIMQL
jgi:hypothetical protein